MKTSHKLALAALAGLAIGVAGDSPEYKAIRPIRQAATRSRIFIAQGVPPQ